MESNTVNKPLYTLKVPESKKNKEWFENYLNYIIPYDTTATDYYTKLKMIYGLVNNNVEILKDTLNDIEKPLGPLFHLGAIVDKEPVVYNKIFPKLMYLVGQYLGRSSDFEPILSSDSSNKLKTDELTAEIEKSINEKILLMQEQMQFDNPEDAQTYYQQMRAHEEPEDLAVKDFKSSVEEFYSDVIKYFKYKFDITSMKELIAKHAIIGDRPIMVVLEEHGRPKPFIFNPIQFGYLKSVNEIEGEKGDYWWYKTPITIAQAYDEIHDKVSQDELERLASYSGDANLRPNKGWDIKSGKAHAQYDYSDVRAAKQNLQFSDKHVGQSQTQGTTSNYFNDETIWKTYFEFKAYRQVIFLTYTSENNREVTDIVPDSFEIPKYAVKVDYTNRYAQKTKRWEWTDEFGMPVYAEKIWIPRRYEVTRYGSDIIVNYREVPNQPTNIDNPFDFELSAKFKTLSALNSESISLVERAISTLMQIMILKDKQTKEIAKYEGYIKNIDLSQIPDALAHDADGNPIIEGADKYQISRLLRKALGEQPYDSTLGAMGLPNYQRTTPVKPEIAGAIQEILLIQQAVDLLDNELGLQMLVPPQAEGIYQPYSNAQDNERAVQQGYIQAEPYFYAIDSVVKKGINEYLIQFRNYYLKFFEDNPNVTETFLNYVTPEGTQSTLKITPDLLSHEDVGLFIHNGGAGEQYRKYMTSVLQPLSQNASGAGLLSDLVLSITRKDSPSEINKRLKLAELDQEKRQQELARINQEAEMFKVNQEKEKNEQLNKHKLEQIALQGEYNLKEKAMDAYKFQDDLNKDQDGIPDHIETLQIMREEGRKDREQNRKDKELELKRKEIAIKQKQANKPQTIKN